MKIKPHHVKFVRPWERDFGKRFKTYSRSNPNIIANPGFVMKVLRCKKIFVVLAYFLLLALTMLNLANYKWTKEPVQCIQPVQPAVIQSRLDVHSLFQTPQPPRKRQLVYVLTTWRSGSSFFGELFNQNPEVFFLYEPMWHIWQKLYPGDAVTLQGAARDMLSSLYRCDFSVFQMYDSPAGRNMTTLMLFGGSYNKVICSYPLCPFYRKDVIGLVDDVVCKRCPPQYLQALEQECLKYNTIVIKGVRIFDLNILAPLMADPSLDLKVIHLVRDPRAVANSKIKSRHGLIRENLQVVRSIDPKARHDFGQKGIKKDSNDFHSIATLEVVCSQMAKTLNTCLKPPDWLKGKVMTVRYEDMVENPIKIVRDVHRFLNMSANPDIEDFAKHMTRGSKSSGLKPFRVSSRNATVALSAWRKELTYQQIKQVEDYCQHSMPILGYVRLRTAAEAKDISRSLLVAPKV